MAIYVASDIHGLKNRFDAMLKELELHDEDHLYILGDVIDRGPDGISILLECMRNKHITLMMGNHEYMMQQVLEATQNMADHHLTYESIVKIERWFRNGCRPTMEAYETLSKSDQEMIYAYLKELPLVIPNLKVNERTFYLVHAHPVLTNKQDILKLEDIANTELTPDQFVWDRILKYQSFFRDRCVIFGHTMTEYYQRCHPYTIWSHHDDLMYSSLIGIDCGCASNNEFTRLACLCLHDMSVRYF